MTRATEFRFDEKDEVVRIWITIMQMNYNELWSLLDDDIDYEDIGKKAFIKKLGGHFARHKKLGDSELILDLKSCNSCNQNKPVCVFTGNRSKRKFALYFDFEQNKVVDIYHCNWYGDDPLNVPF